MGDGCATGNQIGLSHKLCRFKGILILAIIHFISNNRRDLEEQVLEFGEAHSFEIEIQSTIEEFLSCYGENRPKERKTKYEDFQDWMGRFHLVMGYWETRQEWKEARQRLSTWDPRLIKRILPSEGISIEKQFESIFGVSGTEPVSFEYLKKKYMAGLKKKFGTIIARKFFSYQKAQQVPAEKERKLLSDRESSKPTDYPLQYEHLRLIKALSAIYQKKRDATERIEFRKAWPALLWGEDNKFNYLSGDHWFRTLKEHCFQPSDYLNFFDRCPWCMSQDIEVRFFQTPAWTWSWLCGSAGWVVRCTGCEEILLFDLFVQS